MRRLPARALVIVLAGLPVSAVAGLAAPPPDGGPGEDAQRVEEVVAKARELQAEIDRLLLTLPEDLRALALARIGAESAVAADPPPSPAPPLGPGELRAEDLTRDDLTSDGSTSGSFTSDGPARSEENAAPGGAPGALPADTGVVVADPCAGLRLLDTNGDGVLSGADRFWRHLYLRFTEGKESSAFEAGVRQIRLDLRSFSTDGGGVGYIDVGDRVRFDVVVKKRRGAETGYLAIDADRLARDGGPRLLAADGAALEGIQELRTGMVIESENVREVFDCR